MPTFEITAPDGRKFRVTGNGTKEDALAQVQARYQQQPSSPGRAASNPEEYDPESPEFKAKYGPTAGMSGVDKFLAGAGKAFVDIGRGVGQIMGRVSNEDVARQRELDAPLMESGAAKVGNVVGNVAAVAPAMAIPGAATVPGAALLGAASGGLQPSASNTERVANVAGGAAAGAAGQAIGQRIAGWLGQRITNRVTAAKTAQAQNSVRDTTLSEARKVGYVVPPSTTNPSAANRIIEGVSGKAQTQQTAAVRNQQVTNRLVRQDLGLEADAPLTRETLQAVRERAGNVYKAVKGSGEIVVDDAYLDDLSRLTEGIDEVARDFPDVNVGSGEQINKLADSLLRDRFDAKSAVELVKQLRFEASGNFAHGVDPTRRALGMAQRDAAGAVEDMLFRHLKNTGKGNLAQRFDEARQLIAKTYSVEGALNGSTGNVVATNLARELKRGKPLSGGIATAAKFAQAFPKAATEVTDSPGVSAVDALVGGVGAAAVNPAMIALPAARIGARSAVLSKAYQKAAGRPSYNPRTKTLTRAKQGAERLALPAVVATRDPKEKDAP